MSQITFRDGRRKSSYKQPLNGRPITLRRLQTRRLTVGRWPRQREIIVITIKTLILDEFAR
jgi:hypothetical protein